MKKNIFKKKIALLLFTASTICISQVYSKDDNETSQAVSNSSSNPLPEAAKSAVQDDAIKQKIAEKAAEKVAEKAADKVADNKAADKKDNKKTEEKEKETKGLKSIGHFSFSDRRLADILTRGYFGKKDFTTDDIQDIINKCEKESFGIIKALFTGRGKSKETPQIILVKKLINEFKLNEIAKAEAAKVAAKNKAEADKKKAEEDKKNAEEAKKKLAKEAKEKKELANKAS